MRLQFYGPLIIIILLKLQILQASQCGVVKLESDEVYITTKSKMMIFESDTNNDSDVEQFSQSIISQNIKISYKGQGQMISSLIVDPINVESLEGWLFCKFLKNEIYVISCIKDLDFYAEKNTYNNQIDSLILNPQIQSDDICDQFYLNEHSEFLIFCFNLNMFNIYCVNFHNQTTLNLSYQINFQEYIHCKRKYLKLEENSYLLAFYQCQTWGVFSYLNNNLKIILDQQIASLDVNTTVQNIQLCVSKGTLVLKLYLVMETGYIVYEINFLNEIIFNYYQEYRVKLKQILLTSQCIPLYNLRYVENVNKTIISRPEGELEFIGTKISAYLFSDILYVQTHNEFICYFNQILIQHIKINPSYFYFYDYFNLIQQVDIINQEIMFYKFSYHQNILKPTKKYLFLVSFQQDRSIISCKKIKKVQQNNEEVVRIVKFDNKCQNQTDLQLPKKDLVFPFEYEVLLPQQLEQIYIYDKNAFVQSCPMFKKETFINDRLIYIDSYPKREFFTMQSKSRIQIVFCNGTSKFKINNENYDVFSYQNYMLQVNKQLRKLKFINLQNINEGIHESKVGSDILQVLQFDSYIIIITKNFNDFMLIQLDKSKNQNINENLKRFLFKLFQHSLSSTNTIQQDLSFYILSEIPTILQFKNYLIIQLNQGSKIYKIDNIQIVHMKTIFIRSLYYLLTVHLNRNEIIEYYFNLEQISTLNNYTLDQYQIIRPLKYQVNNKYFAIAVRNGIDNFVLIFTIQSSIQLQLINTIKIKRLLFFLKVNQLFYYDNKDVIMIFNIDNFIIQISNTFPFEIDSSVTKRNYSFYIVPKNQSKIEIQFETRSFNLCFRIFNIDNNPLVKIPFSKNIGINIIDYFKGPINEINIINNENIFIKGPILLSENLINQSKIDSISIKPILIPQSFEKLFNKTNGIIVILEEELLIMVPNKFKNQSYQRNFIVLNGKLKLLALIERDKTTITISILQLNENLNFFIEVTKVSISNVFTDTFQEDRIISIENLIIFNIKSNTQSIIYSINGTEIYLQENDLYLLQIVKVGGQNDYYISLSLENFGLTNIFHVFTLKSNKLQPIGQTIIYQSTINCELENYILYDQEVNYLNQLIEFLECTLFQDEVRLLTIQIFTSFSVISQIQINIQDFSFTYKVQKIIRNSQDQTQFNLAYYSQNILLLKSPQNYIYIYDLKVQRRLYDHISSFNLTDKNFYPINTTHMLIYTDSGTNLFIGEFSYQIQPKELNYQEENFILIAQNQVSQARLIVSIDAPKTIILNIDVFTICLCFFVLLLVVFILYFLIRRLKLKQQQIFKNKIEYYS